MSDRSVRVALVDDAPEVLSFMRLFLERVDGVELVGEAESGEEGLELVEKKRPDVLLLDLAMPGMDGLEVLRRLQDRDASHLKVIVISGLSETDQREACMRLGAAAYVEKAAGFDQLPGVILEVAAQND